MAVLYITHLNQQTCWLLLLAILMWTGCAQTPYTPREEQELPVLQDVFDDIFLIGAALNRSQISGADGEGIELVKQQYNTITSENILKWENVHSEPGHYDFEAADQYIQFGEENGMFIVGHTLVWHNQTPDWVFKNGDGTPLNREELLERMRDHIHTVAGRYKGRIHGWDVVNEALASFFIFK